MGFGVVIPSKPVQSDFQQVSNTRWVKTVDNTIPILELCIFKLPNTPLIPEGFGIGIYLCDNTMKEYLDSIFNDKQSVFLHVPQTFENVSKTTVDKFGQISVSKEKNTLYLGLSLENEFTLKNLQGSEKRVQETTSNQSATIAKSLAGDLFHFIESFVKPVQHNNQEVLIMPTDIIEKWLKKTYQKIQMNPYFWKK
eukprot:gene2689-3885_t